MMVSIVHNLLQNNTQISHFKKQLLSFSAEVTKIWTCKNNSRSCCQTQNTSTDLIYALHKRKKFRVHLLLSDYVI